MANQKNRAHWILWDVHAWTGVVSGLVLYVMFFTGAFVLFRSELRSWSFGPQPPPVERSVEEAAAPLLAARADVAWLFELGDDGARVIGGQMRARGQRDHFTIDGRSGALVQEWTAVERILWHLHFLYQLPFGFYLSGFFGLALVLAIVTGVVIHWRNIPSQLLRFRPGRAAKIVWTDAHKVLGTVGLPFLLVFGLTGTIICLGPLLLQAHTAATFGGDHDQAEEILGFVHADVEPAGAPGPRLPYDALIARAKAAVPGLEPEWIRFQHPGDANEVLNVYGARVRGEPFGHATVLLRAADGAVLAANAPATRGPGAIATAAAFALHFVSYGGTAIRLVHALLALGGCAIILSGFAVWLARREAARASRPNRWLLSLVIGTGAGLPLGTAALFAASRALPADLPWRVGWENVALFGTWFAATLYAFAPLPRRRVMRDLLLAAGALWGAAALLDLAAGFRPEAAGVDLALVAFAVFSFWLSSRMHVAARAPLLAAQEG